MKRIQLLCLAVSMLLCLLCGCTKEQDSGAAVPPEMSEAVPETTLSDVDSTLSIHRMFIRPTYAVGDTLDADCMNLHAVFKDGTMEPITEGYTCDPEVLSQAGTQEVTVTYGNIAETFQVEVLDFVSLETEIWNLHDADYNTDGRVNWVLYITARYVGNYVDTSFEHTVPCTGSYNGDLSQAWKDAQNGQGDFWGYGVAKDTAYREYHAGGAIILPDDPDLAGEHSASVIFNGLRKTVTFSLVYDGDYQTGTGWSVADVRWTQEEKAEPSGEPGPREIEWLEVDAVSFYDEAGKYTGPQLVAGFRVNSGDYEGFTAENSAGFELGHELFFGESNYMAFSFKLPDDSSLEGWHTVTLNFDGISRSVDFYLEYLGAYSHAIGTADSVDGIGWEVTQWRASY